MRTSLQKIVIIGSESTGKSTVAEALSKAYNTTFVPEYARQYIDELNRPYVYEDLWQIAKGQLKVEQQQAQKAKHNLLFCDTDLNVIKVWSEQKYDTCDERILKAIGEQKYDFYFLTNIDFPWIFDPQREHPHPRMRQFLFNIYKDIVQNSGLPWALLSGHEEERLQSAIATLSQSGIIKPHKNP